MASSVNDEIRPQVDAAIRLASKMRIAEIACIGVEAKHLGHSEGSLAFSVPNITIRWTIAGDEVRAIFPFQVLLQARVDDETTTVATINVGYVTVYKVPPQVAEEDIPHFIGISGYMQTWPYFRADVQTLSAKLGFPPLTLPLLVSSQAAEKATVVRLLEPADGECASKSAAVPQKKRTKARRTK
jgi:hypothetical protein